MYTGWVEEKGGYQFYTEWMEERRVDINYTGWMEEQEGRYQLYTIQGRWRKRKVDFN